jgi:hypothetical protein
MANAVSGRPLTAEARVHPRAIPGEICVGQNDTDTGFSPSYSVLFCQCNSTVAHASYSGGPGLKSRLEDRLRFFVVFLSLSSQIQK